jgi:pimeloyl-ACP methyl ester carboxylesterase
MSGILASSILLGMRHPFFCVLVTLAFLSVSCKSSGDLPPWEVNDLNDHTRAQAGGSYVALPLGSTHYELLGPDTGRTVVLVHGSTLPQWTWDRQVAVLTDAGFRVLRYDHFGRGYSDRPVADYGIDLYCDQLGQLIDTLRLRKPISLVGISFGCAILAAYASRHPADVDRMIFTAPVVDPLNDVAKLLTKSSVGAVFVRSRLKKQVEGDIRRTLRARGMPDRYADFFIEQASIKGFQRSLLSFFRNAAVVDYRPYYRKTGELVPRIMLIWGDDDKTVRKSQVFEFEKAIPAAQVVVLKGIGHLAPFEATQEFNDLILSFLKKSQYKCIDPTR